MVSTTFMALLLTQGGVGVGGGGGGGGGVLAHKYSRQLDDFKGHSYRQVVFIKNFFVNPHIHPSMNYGFEFILFQ